MVSNKSPTRLCDRCKYFPQEAGSRKSQVAICKPQVPVIQSVPTCNLISLPIPSQHGLGSLRLLQPCFVTLMRAASNTILFLVYHM
jgi:hypothetical protein